MRRVGRRAGDHPARLRGAFVSGVDGGGLGGVLRGGVDVGEVPDAHRFGGADRVLYERDHAAADARPVAVRLGDAELGTLALDHRARADQRCRRAVLHRRGGGRGGRRGGIREKAKGRGGGIAPFTIATRRETRETAHSQIQKIIGRFK